MKIINNVSLLLVVFVTACASPQSSYIKGSSAEVEAEIQRQQEFALKTQYDNARRLQKVSFPILTKNAELCEGNTGPYFGMGLWNEKLIEKEYRPVASRLYGLDEHVNVYITVPGTPSAKAGLNKGDKILAVNGQTIKAGKSSLKKFYKEIEKAEKDTFEFLVSRNGEQFIAKVSPTEACDFKPMVIWGDNTVNAYADGDNIMVSQGMMRFASNDNELALVVSHELAHNAMLHIDAKQKNAAVAGIAGILMEVAIASAGGYTDGSITNSMMNAGAQTYSVEFEQEADYVGMYMMARAGYPITNAANFWRRMAADIDSNAIKVSVTHPTTPERFIALEKTKDEINSKLQSGKKLVPNMKKD